MLKWISMLQILKKFIKQILAFICDQYLVLILILITGFKLYFFNTFILKVTWPENHYIYGIVCGLFSVAVIFSPLFFVRKRKNQLTILLAFLISVLLLVDTVYFSYFAALPTMGLIGSLGQTEDIGPAIEGLLKWWFLLYFVDIALAIILFKPMSSFFKNIKEKNHLENLNNTTNWLAFIVTLAAFGLTLLPMGINHLVTVFNSGYDTVSTSQYYGVLMAHAIDVARFIKQETTSLSLSQEKTLANWVNNNKPAQTTNPLTGSAKGKNIIMIQVESLGGFVINQDINGKEITPNLDALSKTAQFFPNDRFIIGAGHTSDTDFVVNSSYFPLPDAAVFVRYGQDAFTSLPKIMVANGYSTYAYHGFNRNFWNRNVALKSLGYQKFYAADNYPKGAVINMGLNDGDFLSKTADYIKSQPKPSLSYVITLSSHVPFAVTDQTKGLNINTSDYPNMVGGYLEDINYTDRMLGAFFTKLKAEGLYDDSLIIVYGDHTPVLPAFSAGTIKYNPDTVQVKEVPLLIKLPNETIGKTYVDKGTHLDIMPTILDLSGIKTSDLMFGQSLFAQGDKALKTCSDQLPAFPTSGDCNVMLTNEKAESSTIIRYNQFNNIQNKKYISY
jgi:phosphoglycerol transferase MdoB-like AlkP superfamily enzyme